jgi:hypothetical protein
MFSPSFLEASPPLCRRVKMKCKGAVMGAEREPHMATYYCHGPPLRPCLNIYLCPLELLTYLPSFMTQALLRHERTRSTKSSGINPEEP